MYDLIIIGAGIAGMTASIYASRYGIKHLIFGENPGGQGNLSHLVENYPGILSIEGPELMQKIISQVESYGVKIRQERVVGLKLKGQSSIFEQSEKSSDTSRVKLKTKTQNSKINSQFLVKTSSGEEHQVRTLILAMGASYRHLNIPGEEKFLGKGVSYCTSCDAPLFKGKIVAVVGGGDSAASGALHLSNFAKKVYLIHRRDKFRAEKAWVKKLKKKKNIKLVLSSVVKEVFGKEKVEGVVVAAEVAHAFLPKAKTSGFEKTASNLRGPLLTREQPQGVHDVSGARSEATSANFVGSPPQAGKEEKLEVDGLFIEIGQIPSSVLAKQLGIELDERGYVLVGPDMATNVSGVFAAGDLASQKGGILFRQFITSASDGARAAASVYQYLTKKTITPSWGKR